MSKLISSLLVETREQVCDNWHGHFSGCVHQYLCLVPQDRKFCNALTSVIVFESARWVTDFSALKAARAFEAIEKYAANLINQPWRKEFKEIKVRCIDFVFF